MNPYKVLGVSENADDETIKKAYKELVKKYHPDKYVNNPLADLAADKMKEINKAYDMLTKNKGAAPNNANQYGSSGYNYGGYGDFSGYRNTKPTFTLIRQLIASGRITQALTLLQQMERTAEWYFLSGVANINRGWYDQGMQYLQQAVRMEPGNTEYSDMLNNVKNKAGSYNDSGSMYTSSGCCPSLPCFCIPCFCPGCWC